MIPETEIAKMKERVEDAKLDIEKWRYVSHNLSAVLLSDVESLLAERSELLSKIEEQERELVRLREGWVSVKDRMPDDCRRVLVCMFGCLITEAHYNHGKKLWRRGSEMLGELPGIEHWRDFPAPPRPFTSQEVYEGIPELVSKAEEMEKQGVPVVDVPKVGE